MRPGLADRLRGIVGTGHSTTVPAGAETVVAPSPSDGARTVPAPRARAEAAAVVLGGRIEAHADGLCLVVARDYAATDRHGRHEIGRHVARLRAAREGLARLARAWPSGGAGTVPASPLDPDTLCVLDLETTGLAGGAGTQAFLVGCAVLDGDGVHVRQFLLPGPADEPAQLALMTAWLAGRTALVTFNGRSFDVPLLSMRGACHRLPCPWEALPHVDVLHPARRLWRETHGAWRADGGCSLGALEQRLGGVRRVGDVPGAEIPARFFQFVRDGDARPLEGVLEHNRLDLLSTLLLLARAADLAWRGAAASSRPGEALGLGRLLERADAPDEAEASYAHAAARATGAVRAEALRRLALLRRRRGEVAGAAEAWQALLATRGADAALRREAREALAIHHEHRSKDLAAARALAHDLLAEAAEAPAAQADAVRHRLARLDRKLGQGPACGPLFDDPGSGV